MIKTERNVFIGGHVTRVVKAALDALAKARRVSLSYLVYSILVGSAEIKPLLPEEPKEKE